MITCFLRYRLNVDGLADFERYAALWIELVARFGGEHHGYYLPSEGSSNVALALFSFASLADYEAYRRASEDDPECAAAYRLARESGCIESFERSFFRPLRAGVGNAERVGAARADAAAGGLFDAGELRRGLEGAAELVEAFYDGLEVRRVAPERPLAAIRADFAGTLGEAGVGVAGALRDVEQHVLPNAMAIPHPRYFGLINSSPLPGGIVAESIVGALNNNAGAWQQGPPLVAAEEELLRCLAGVLGLAPEATGIVLPGGSYATLHALQLARDARLPEWRARGARSLAGDPRVYVTEASHFSAVRAAIAVGVAPRDVVRVPSLDRGAIDPRALAEQLRADRAAGALPFAVIATLGTTGTGAMDPLPELVELCREHGVWLHVDACYGGAAALLPELSERFRGLDAADSVAVDPHKWFFVPMVAGLLFTRHPKLELEVFDIDASYIPTEEFVDGFRRALPTSRRAAGFPAWMTLRAHGLGPIRAAVRLNCELSRRLEERLASEGFEVMPKGELSIACARWPLAGATASERDAAQARIAAAVVASGHAWIGTVRVRGESWLRLCQVSTFTRAEHIDDVAQRLGEIAREWGGDARDRVPTDA